MDSDSLTVGHPAVVSVCRQNRLMSAAARNFSSDYVQRELTLRITDAITLGEECGAMGPPNEGERVTFGELNKGSFCMHVCVSGNKRSGAFVTL